MEVRVEERQRTKLEDGRCTDRVNRWFIRLQSGSKIVFRRVAFSSEPSKHRLGRVAEWFKAPVLKFAKPHIGSLFAVSERQEIQAKMPLVMAADDGLYRPVAGCWVDKR
jgi:hypothetical protein